MQKNEKKEKLNNKYLVFLLILLVGLAILILLSLNFTSTYKFKENSNSINSKVIYKQDNLNEKKHLAEEIKDNVEAKVLDTKKEIKNEVINMDNSCKALFEFVQDYYQLKLKVDEGANFTKELLDLNKYNINSEEINQSLKSLLAFSSANNKGEYFKAKFSSLIKDLYRLNTPSSNIISDFIRKMFFVRPIGDRAIANGGFDMEVALIEKSLKNDNLVEALVHINNILNVSDSLKKFKSELENKLAINEALIKLDNIILSKLECEVVGK
jgi:hypothetical protein